MWNTTFLNRIFIIPDRQGRWDRHWVPKRRLLNFRRRGNSQKNTNYRVFIKLSVEFCDTQMFSSLNVVTWKLTIQDWDWRCVGGERSPTFRRIVVHSSTQSNLWPCMHHYLLKRQEPLTQRRPVKPQQTWFSTAPLSDTKNLPKQQ